MSPTFTQTGRETEERKRLMQMVYRRMSNGRRGISPLIATVLLIAFAVSLGAMIMNWSNDFSEDEGHHGEETHASVEDCSSIELKIQAVKGKPSLCYDIEQELIRVVLRNTGQIAIDGVNLRIIDAEFNIFEEIIEGSSMQRGGIMKKEVAYATSNLDQTQVTFTPILGHDDGTFCVESEIVTETLNVC